MKRKAAGTVELVTTISAFSLLLLLVIAAGVIAVELVWPGDQRAILSQEPIRTEVIVQPGDTLWSIARSQQPDEDPRAVVAYIRELNQLQSAEIFPGQVLTLEIKQAVQPIQMASTQPN